MKKASQKEVDLSGVPINCLVDELCARNWNVALRRPKGWKKAPVLIYCDRCDGCGWYEGGKTLQTKCEDCNGTGTVPSRDSQ